MLGPVTLLRRTNQTSLLRSLSATHKLARCLLTTNMNATTTTTNPLIDIASSAATTTNFPDFGAVQADHVIPGIGRILYDCDQQLKELETSLTNRDAHVSGDLKPDELIQPLSHMLDRLTIPWGVVGHLKAVKDNENLRSAVEAVLPQRVQFGLRVSQSKPLYDGFKSILESGTPLSEAQHRVVTGEIRDAELSGITLEDNTRFNEIQQRLSTLSTTFSNNVLDASKAYKFRAVHQTQVDGIPTNVLATVVVKTATNSVSDGSDDVATAPPSTETGPWDLTLDQSCFVAVMSHCTCRDTREQLFHAYTTRASDMSASEGIADNTPIVEEMLHLRQERAELLGYANHAELSCASKMASVPEALELIEKLRSSALPVAMKESVELHQFAAMEYGVTETLLPFDRSFYAERLREKKYAYSEAEVRPYFSLPVVLDGLFQLCSRLFGVTFAAVDFEVSVWNEHVKLYEVRDRDAQPIAYFYADLYSRPGEKRSGAWMAECMSRMPGRLPVAHIVCNQAPPTDTEPSLMTFRDVETLFHEFGHALQHMLTEQDIPLVTGIRGIEWDAVEIPSQFMENFCYDAKTMSTMAKHCKTGETMPEDLFQRIKRSRNFMSGTVTLRQLYFAMLDLKLHMGGDVLNQNPHAVAFELAKSGYQVTEPMDYDRFICSFSHVFAGPYAAGYYSYKWSEVLSSDCFSSFEEVGLHNEKAVAEIGAKFRQTILAAGGGRDPAGAFQDFRGRPFQIDALLRHTGLTV